MHETKAEMAKLEALLKRSKPRTGGRLGSVGVEEWFSARQLADHLQGVRTVAVATVDSKLEPRVEPMRAILFHGKFYVAVDKASQASHRVQRLTERRSIGLTYMRDDHALITVHGTASFVRRGDSGFRDVDAAWKMPEGIGRELIVYIEVEPSSVVALTTAASGLRLRDIALENRLRAHLENHYGVRVVGMNRLDVGVFCADLHEGRSWIARVFPPERTVEQVRGDADVLRFLEEHRFPAERCAHPDPVSTLEGRGLLVTEKVEATAVEPSESNLRALGEMLARLNALPAGAGRVSREAGSLHHYSPREGGPRNELDAAISWLDAVEDEVPAQNRAPHRSLRERLARADDCHGLPEALIHPDPVLKNVVATPEGFTWIDWTGAGRGPRLLPLTILIWSGAMTKDGWEPRRVDAVAAGYRSQVRPQEDELARITNVMPVSILIFACWRYRHAMLSGKPPDGTEWWWPSDELTLAVAARARKALSGPARAAKS